MQQKYQLLHALNQIVVFFLGSKLQIEHCKIIYDQRSCAMIVNSIFFYPESISTKRVTTTSHLKSLTQCVHVVQLHVVTEQHSQTTVNIL